MFKNKVKKIIAWIMKHLEILLLLIFLLYVLLNAGCRLIIKDGELIGIKSGIFQKKDTLTSITIPESVTIITGTAFEGCERLESIDMPDTVSRIESFAFLGTRLSDIKLSANLTRIEGYTFEDCFLSTIDIPDSVTYIGTSAFKNCTYLKRVDLPEKLEKIDDEAFSGCTRLVDIKIPKGVIELGKDAFAYTKCLEMLQADEYGSYYLDGILVKSEGEVSDIIIKEGTMVIADGTFKGKNSLNSIRLPDGLIAIGYEAFAECYNLCHADFPNSLKKFASNSFAGTNLSNIKLPEGAEIYNSVFADCINLTNVELPDELRYIGMEAFWNTPWMESLERDEYGCTYADYILLKCEGKKENLIIRPGTKVIAGAAVYACHEVENIQFPEGLLAIGERAFSGCYKIKHIILPNSVKILGNLAFFPDEIESINLPDGLEVIGVLPFNCQVEEFRVPESVVILSDNAFDACRKLKRLMVPGHLRGRFFYDGKAEVIYY